MQFFSYSDIFIKFWQEFTYKERVGRWIFFFLQNGDKKCKVGPKKIMSDILNQTLTKTWGVK